jgi:hypothetical protein
MSDEPLGGRQCTARSKRSGQRCQRAPVTGGTVCWAHGGAAGQVRRAAARRVAEAEIVAAGERFAVNGDRPVDVLAELERLTAVVTSFMSFATARVEALSPDEWAAFGPRTAAQVDVFRAALVEARRLLTELARLGLTERQIREQREAYQREVDLRVGALIFRVMIAVLTERGEDVSDPRLRDSCARHLKAEASAARGA